MKKHIYRVGICLYKAYLIEAESDTDAEQIARGKINKHYLDSNFKIDSCETEDVFDSVKDSDTLVRQIKYCGEILTK